MAKGRGAQYARKDEGGALNSSSDGGNGGGR